MGDRKHADCRNRQPLRRLPLLAATALLIPAGTTAAAPPARPAPPAAAVPGDLDYLPDLAYGTAAGQTLRLDLARPKQGAGRLPLVVYFHGGGWVKGDRKACLPEVFRTARAGYVAVTVGHRLAPDHRFPAQLDDARRALAGLRDNAGRHGIDPDRVGVVGYCSGGTLACLLGGGGQPTRPRAVVAYYTPTDLALWHKHADQLPFVEQQAARYALGTALGGTPEQLAGRYAQASPVIASDPDAPADIREVFARILPQEEFHERAFRAFASDEALTAALERHAAGAAALGLVV
jgi:acetyl esterase/lipase